MSSISIAMATYNGARFIEEQLNSLASQTYLPSELVVTDDQSTDNTVELLRKFARDCPFPVHIHLNNERLGWRANFIKTSGLCVSDLIGFCDQDDVWYRNKIEACVAPFHDEKIMLVHHNADLINESCEHLGTLYLNTSTSEVLEPLAWSPLWQNPLGFTMVFRKKLTECSRFWPLSIDKTDVTKPSAHDQWYYFLAGCFGKTQYLARPLVAYRQHSANAVGWREDATLSIESRKSTLELLAEISRNRVKTLQLFEQSCDLNHPALLTRAIECNSLQCRYLSAALRLHQTRGALARASRFLSLLFSRAYLRGDAWGLGRRAILEDAKAAFPFHLSNQS